MYKNMDTHMIVMIIIQNKPALYVMSFTLLTVTVTKLFIFLIFSFTILNIFFFASPAFPSR